MQSKASTIKAYLLELPPEKRSVVKTLDKLVRSAAPKSVASMKYGMPTYEVASRIIAFNAQKNYFSFYADPKVVKQYRSELKGLGMGKSCIRFRTIEEVSLAALRKIVKECAK